MSYWIVKSSILAVQKVSLSSFYSRREDKNLKTCINCIHCRSFSCSLPLGDNTLLFLLAVNRLVNKLSKDWKEPERWFNPSVCAWITSITPRGMGHLTSRALSVRRCSLPPEAVCPVSGQLWVLLFFIGLLKIISPSCYQNIISVYNQYKNFNDILYISFFIQTLPNLVHMLYLQYLNSNKNFP